MFHYLSLTCFNFHCISACLFYEIADTKENSWANDLYEKKKNAYPSTCFYGCNYNHLINKQKESLFGKSEARSQQVISSQLSVQCSPTLLVYRRIRQ